MSKLNIGLIIAICLLTIWSYRQYNTIRILEYNQKVNALVLEEIKEKFIPEKDLLAKHKKYSKPGFGRIVKND